ncbi:MAG: DUF5668 domain-containing protein [Actinomycetota bacterium]|jgi:hypothetical protein|nr:DUF5668 domain-containing protein [Actinomycetota bacterium]
MHFNKAVEGLTLVAVGLIFLGNTTGALPWSVWISIFSLWPLLLVAAGVDLIGKGLDNTWLRVLSSLVVLAGLVFGALFMTPGSWGFGLGFMAGDSEPYSYTARADREISEGRLVIEGAFGDVDITDGGRLVEVSGKAIGDRPEFDLTKSGNEVLVELVVSDARSIAGVPDEIRMNVALSRHVLWDIEVQAGAAAIDGDLRDLAVASLSVDTGVSDAAITLGGIPRGVDEVPIRVDTGVSSVTIRIPDTAEARVVADTGIAVVNTSDDFDRVSDEDTRIWETEGYDDATARYEISVDAGVGSVTIERYEETR